MALAYKLKHRLTNAFRELFLYHHSSLEFRARLFALIIAANEDASECEYELVKAAGMQIYNDEDRANALSLTTQEFVGRIYSRKDRLDIDTLIQEIVRELKVIPRYAKKIETSQLEPLIDCTLDEDTKAYQRRMITFLDRLKDEYEG